MLGPNDLVLCAGTVPRAGFAELADAAAAGGFRGISVQPHLYERARAEGASDAELRRLLDDRGLEIAELDALLSWLPGAPPPAEGAAGAMLRTTAEDFFRIADAIGGRSLNVAQLLPGAVDVDVAAEALADVCDGAARCGLAVSLEFLPWSGIPDPATALAIVERCGRPNAGLMVDAWHVFRGSGDVEALGLIPGERIVGVQLDDAPTEAAPVALVETLEARLVPGEGDIDLVALVRALDRIGSTAPIGVEVYSKALAAEAATDVARRVGDATREILRRARE